MRPDNKKAIKMIIKAMRYSDFDCSDWDTDELESVAKEIITVLAEKSMFIVVIDHD